MSDLKLDSNGDLAIENSDFVIITGIDSIKQNLKQNLQFFLHEWFLNTTLGVPYIQTILIKNPDLSLVDGLLRSAILQTAGVVELLEFTFALNAGIRELTISFKVLTDAGLLSFDDEVVI